MLMPDLWLPSEHTGAASLQACRVVTGWRAPIVASAHARLLRFCSVKCGSWLRARDASAARQCSPTGSPSVAYAHRKFACGQPGVVGSIPCRDTC